MHLQFGMHYVCRDSARRQHRTGCQRQLGF